MSEPETTGNGEWSAWREAWVSERAANRPVGREAAEPAELAVLRRRLDRQRRRQIAVAAVEWLGALALVAVTVAMLRGGAAAWQIVWLATLWAFTAVAGGFAWWNRRATWRAAGAAVEDAVRLARLRAERQLRTVRFVLLLFAAEVVVVVAQLAWFDRLLPVAFAALGAAGIAIALWCAVTRRRLRRELARIDAFARELPDPG
jgi:hypothetical protein